MTEYAAHLNDIYQTQDYSAGLRDGPWTRFSTRADQNVFEPIGRATTGPLFGSVGSLFGHEAEAQHVGESLPRMFANMAPLLIPGVGEGYAAGALGAGLTGLAFGGHTYADTGSPKAGLISGLTGALMPSMGRLGGNIAARAFGVGERVAGDTSAEALASGMPDFLSGVFPKAGQETQFKAAQFLGQQAANIGMTEGSSYAIQKTLDPSTSFNPLSPDFLIQQIPWTVMDALHMRRPVGMTSDVARSALKVPESGMPKPTPLSGPIQAPHTEEQQQMVGQALANYAGVVLDPTVSPQEKSAKFAATMTSVMDPKAVDAMKKTAVMADPASVPVAPMPEANVQVMGHAESVGNGNYRVRVLDYTGTKQVPEHKTMFVNGAEPTIDPETKLATFDVSDAQVQPAIYGKSAPVASRVRSEDEAQAPNPPTPVDPQLELQQRAEGVRPMTIPEGPRSVTLQQHPSEITDEFNQGFTILVNGKPVGDLKGFESPGHFQVKSVELKPEFQGKGVYPKTIQQLLKKYGKVESDDDRTENASKVWQKLGGSLTEQNTYILNKTDRVDVVKPPEIDDPFGATTLNEADRAALKGVGVEASEEPEASPTPTVAPDYGSTNRVFTSDAVAAARARMAERRKNVTSGVDPTVVMDAVVIGGYHIEAGLRKFGAWAQEMLKEGFDMDHIKAAWEQLKNTEVGKMVEEDHMERLKATAASIDQTQSALAESKAKVEKVPESATDLVDLVGEQAKPKIEGELSKGASSDQAAETARLVAQTPGYTEAQAKLVALAKEAETIVNGSKKEKAQKAKAEAKRTALQKETETAAAALDAAHLEYSRLASNPIEEKGPAKDAYEAQLAGAGEYLVAAGRAAQKLTNTLAKLGPHAVRAEDLSGGEQNKYGLALKDEEGNRLGFATVQAAQDHLVELPEPDNWRVRDGGADRGEKRYYLAPVENLQASMDETHGEGASLENKLPSETGDLSGAADLEETLPQDGGAKEAVSAELVKGEHSLPQVSEEGLYDTIERMESDSLVDTSWELGFDGDTLQAKLALHQAKVYFAQAKGGKLRVSEVNAALADAGLLKFKDQSEMDRKMLNVLQTIRANQKSPMVALLGSKIPHDEALTQATGIRQGLAKAINWVSKQTDLGGQTAEFAKAYLNFPDVLAQADVRLPYEHDAWMPGTFFENTNEGKAINLDTLPTEDTRVKWATDLVHETTHLMENALASRDDPAAVEYTAEKRRILDQVRKSKDIPQDVRKVLQTSIDENHYIKSANDQMNLAEFWKDKLGVKKSSEWFDVMYALVHPNEFVAQMMSSKKVQAFMAATQVKGKFGVQSVLNWFSQAFNRLIGGKDVMDNALSQMLGAYDNYLTGGLLRHTYNGHDYIRDMLVNTVGVRPEALASRLNTMDRMFAKGDLYASIGGFQREGENGLLPATSVSVPPKSLPIIRPVIGLKRPWLTPENQQLLAGLAFGKGRVMDTFLGSGLMSNGLREFGFKGDVIQNERDVIVHTALSYLQQKGAVGIEEVRALSERLLASKTPQEFKAIVDTYPNRELALFVGAQANHMGRSLEKSHTLVPSPNQYFRLKSLPERLTQWLATEPTLANEDGFAMTKTAKDGDLVVFDPPYLGTDTYRTNLQKSGVEEITQARDQGASVLYFNSHSPELEKQLADSGFEVRREKIGNVDTLVANTKVNENLRPVDQPLRTSLVNPAVNARGVYDIVMQLLPDQLPVHQELFYRMQQDVELTKNLYREVNAGNIEATIPVGAEDRLRLAEVKVNAMRRALRKQNLAMDRQNQLKNFTYEGLDDTLAEQLSGPRLPSPEFEPPEMDQAQGLMGLRQYLPRTEADVRRETSAERLAGKSTLTWYEKNLMFTAYTKKLHPEVRPVVSHVQDAAGNAIQIATKLNLVLNGRVDPTTGQYHIDPDVQKQMQRVDSSKALTQVFNDAVQLIATRVKAGGPQWSWNDKEFKQLLRPLRPEDRQAVITKQAQFNMRHENFVNDVLPTEYGKINRENTARVFASLENGMLPETARGLSSQLYDALGMMNDPQMAVTGQQVLSQLSQTVKPETFIEALKHASTSQADLQGLLDVAQKNYDFVSEQRYKEHHLRMTAPDGSSYRSDSADLKTLEERKTRLEAQGYKFEYYTKKSEANAPAGGVNADLFAKLREMDALSVTRLTTALSGRPDSAQLLDTVLPEAKRADMLATSTQAFTPVPGMSRKLVAGREELNMSDNAHQFYVNGVNWLRHKIVRAQTGLDMMHPEIAGNTELKNYVDQHVQNYLTPDNPIVRKLTEAVFYQRMAFNFGNAALEAFQSLGTGMQALIAETGSVGDAYGTTASAMKDMAQHKATGTWATPELEWFSKWAASVGLRRMTLWDDIQDPDTASVMSSSARLGTPVQKTFSAMRGATRKFSTFFQNYNNDVTSIAAFKLGLEKENGATDSAALLRAAQFARDITTRGTFTGGKAQRSVGLWGIKTKAVPQLMSSLNTYTLGWFSQMATDWKIGFRGAGSDVTPQQRLGSKKAFLYGLAAQATLAGGLGLPGVGQGIALLNQTTGLDLKGWLRQNLSKLFDEDQNFGGLLTNLALRGAANAITPIDPSNRASISVPFVGVDPYKGFSIDALAGAPGTSVSDFVQGLMAAASGNIPGVQKLLPSVLKGPAQLIQGEGDVRDARGALLQTLSPSERFFQAIGVPSSRVQQARDAADALKRQQQQAQRTRESLVDQLATLTRKGNIQGVQSQILALKKADPTLDIRSLGQSISDRVTAQTIPYEARRSVNPAMDLSGFQSGGQSTEVLRRQTGYATTQALGLPVYYDPHADFQAQRSDDLMNSNPFLTRAAALNAVRTPTAAHQYMPAWTQGSQ